MKQVNLWLVVTVLFTLCVAGCGENSTGNADTEKKLKESFSNKEFDINKVPPEQRERVKALMGGSGAASKDAGKPAPK